MPRSRESSHAQLAGAGGKPPKTRGRFLIIDENSPAHGPNPHAEPPPDMLDPPSRAHTGAGADLPPVQALLDGCGLANWVQAEETVAPCVVVGSGGLCDWCSAVVRCRFCTGSDVQCAHGIRAQHEGRPAEWHNVAAI